MKIAIIGAGNMGRALAGALVRAGHDVALAFGRDEAKVAAAAEQTLARPATPAGAVSGADVVVLAVPPEALDTALAATGSLDGSLVVSVSSGLTLDPTGAQFGLPTDRTMSVAEEVAAKTGAVVVQAFTLAFADLIAAGGGGRAVLPLAGDDDTAVDTVAGLVDDIDFVPLRCGGLQSARAGNARHGRRAVRARRRPRTDDGNEFHDGRPPRFGVAMTFDPRRQRSAEPFVLDTATAPAYWFVGTYWRVLASGAQTAGRSCTFDELCPRGLVAPLHVHADAEEAFFVLEGEFVFAVGEDEINAGPGSYVYLPPGVQHGFRVESEVGRVYNTLTPAGFEQAILSGGVPAPQIGMPAPGVSAVPAFRELAPGRPPAPWETPPVSPPG